MYNVQITHSHVTVWYNEEEQGPLPQYVSGQIRVGAGRIVVLS